MMPKHMIEHIIRHIKTSQGISAGSLVGTI